MTYLLEGKELGVPVAEITVENANDIQLLDDRFVLVPVGVAEAEETIRIVSE